MKQLLKSIFTKRDGNISPADNADLRRKKSSVISSDNSRGGNYLRMKIFSLYISLFLLLLLNTANAKNVQAFLSYCTFYSQDKGAYIETYLSVVGRSVHFVKNKNEKFQGSIAVSIIFKKGDTIKYQDKYNLLSPEVDDSSKINFTFLDQQRIGLEQGKYNFEIAIADNNVPSASVLQAGEKSKAFQATGEIIIQFPDSAIALSDIELLESYKKSTQTNMLTKNGYDFIPFVDNFYPAERKSLKFYVEIYNAKKLLNNEIYLIKYFVQSHDSKRIFEKSAGFLKQTPQETNVVLAEISIEELTSGNYDLVIEVRNRENKTMASKKVFFQRSNEINTAVADDDDDNILNYNVENTFASYITSRDTLAEFIRCLRPISNGYEPVFITNQLKTAELKLMQQFFYGFWLKRNKQHPAQAWRDYYLEVRKVNNSFGAGIMKGYETDRGRVYLQYGPPSSINSAPYEPSAYPYEIWQYDQVKNQTNRKFVFYNTDLVSRDYSLLHSDAIGEVSDYRWELKIHKRDTPSNNLDDQKAPDHFGGNLEDNFKNPK